MWQYAEPHVKIPGLHVYQLLGHLARSLGDERFGFLVPEHTPLTSTGGVGALVWQALTVFDAINTLNRLYVRMSNFTSFFVSEDAEGVWWCRKRLHAADLGLRQMELYSFGYMLQVVRMGAGPSWSPTRVCLEFDSISRLDRLEAFAEAEVLCRRGISGFAIPRSVLMRPIPACPLKTFASPDDGLLAEAPSTEFVPSLRQILRSFVRVEPPRIETIAEAGGLGVRTLQRRLAAEGLTFKKVVGQARFQVAAELVSRTDVKLVDIAQDLGYGDQAHFTRAFRRWAGVSPSQYRSQQHSN
jgi:AraC-like DNA-binding protein